jgi:hypothetical protein
MFDTVVFLIALLIGALLLFGQVFYLIMFSDLECDFMNPIEMCNRLNALTLPEYFIQAFLSVMFLLSFNLVPLVLHSILTAYHYLKWTRKDYIYDATEIFRQIPKHKIESFVKLMFYLLSFFYFLYRFVVSLVD